jgi:hypothetical protein
MIRLRVVQALFRRFVAVLITLITHYSVLCAEFALQQAT